ncbi:MAG: hypothetical protein JW787_14495 [Sedimentisphaerales bacterium]|nr:hypothetical protein [Sedimentisphaerales bacterium]
MYKITKTILQIIGVPLAMILVSWAIIFFLSIMPVWANIIKIIIILILMTLVGPICRKIANTVANNDKNKIDEGFHEIRTELPKYTSSQDNHRNIVNYKNHRILTIDDNPHIHNDWKQLLKKDDTNFTIEEQSDIFDSSSDSESNSGFEIDSAFQGKEGLEKIILALKENRPYVMAIVDIRMPPGWDGVNTIEHILEVCPDLHIVISAVYSDYTCSDIVEKLGKSEKLVVLKYPYNNIEVQQFIIGLNKKIGSTQLIRIENALKQMAQVLKPQFVHL